MASINSVIPPQGFEIVRDRIGRIIADELDNQFQISYDNNLRVSNWVERFIPFDGGKELPAVNVSLAEGNFDWQTQIQSIGTYRYFIDCYVNARRNDDDMDSPGDVLANVNLQRLMGIVRAIVENPIYMTLGFAKPFIMNRHFESIQIQNPDQKKFDLENCVMGRLMLSVRIPETTPLKTPANAAGFDTRILLAETMKGYQWVFDNGYDTYDFAND